MRTGKSRYYRWPPGRPWLGLLLGLALGCATERAQFDHALLACREMGTPAEQVVNSYVIACPDLLEVTVAGEPEWSGQVRVEPDGCIKLSRHGRIRVEGSTPATAAEQIAEHCGVLAAAVQVRVAEYCSQQIYLVGEINGSPRPVSYVGKETVLDLLQRVGGPSPGAELEDIHVIRSQVAVGDKPEAYRVDLRAIVLRHDASTNVSLEPFDQVSIGESRQCCLRRCLPPWLRPLFERVCGMHRN